MNHKVKHPATESYSIRLSEPFCFCPLVTSLFLAEGFSKTPRSEGENQRVAGLECEADEAQAHLWGMAVLPWPVAYLKLTF